MKELYLKMLETYLLALKYHINTKTTDIVFHKETENIYEKLFEFTHDIGEKIVDNGNFIENISVSDQKRELFEKVKSMKEYTEKFFKEKDMTPGEEDLVGGIANELESILGTLKGFQNK